jgi:hypothetical protein
MTLQADLQRLSGTTLDAQGAANVLAGTTGLELVGALNAYAGTAGEELLGVIREISGGAETLADYEEEFMGAVLGYEEVVANQTGITTAAADLTGLTITVTVPEGRQIKIQGHVLWQTTAGTPGVAVVRVMEGATVLNEGAVEPHANGRTCDAFAPEAPSAGEHTYKLVGITDSGTVTLAASAARPSFILVEDMGPAV